MWTPERLQELFGDLRTHGGDRTDVEVKLGTGGCPTVIDTLCAFANLPTGGTIIVGVDEAADFAVVGVHDVATIEQGIASQARNALIPPPHVEFEIAVVDDRQIVVAVVTGLPASDRPCRTKSGGHAYLRQADGDCRMSEQEIAQLISLRDRPRYDSAPVPLTSVADLDPRLVPQFIAEARTGSRRLAEASDDQILRFRAVIAPGTDQLSVAGLYALGTYPQQFIPSLAVTAAVELPDRREGRTRDLADFDGPLPDLLDQAMEWVRRNTGRTMRYGPDGHGMDEDEIPMVAVRELIANALVHRDLGPHTQTKRVEIRIKDDRLVITNPGGLWGITVAQLGTAAGKSSVNEYLYDMSKLIRTPNGKRIIEGEGGGIREARAALRKAGLRTPTFSDASVRFTAVVSRHSLLTSDDLAWLGEVAADAPLSDMQREILVSMRSGQIWTNSLVRDEYAPIDSIAARALLQGLVNAGVADALGDRGSTTYRLAAHLVDDTKQTTPTVDVIAPLFPTDDRQIDLPAVSKNAPAVWDSLDRPGSLAEIAERSGLSHSQTSYALRKLAHLDLVEQVGGRGDRSTEYRRR